MAPKFIVIEGLDSTGKETQSNLLVDKLRNEGNKVLKISYPNYDSRSSELVKMYLNGEILENPEDINPYATSTFYAADRYITYIKEYKDIWNDYDYIIADRYVESNMIYQLTKLWNKKDPVKFISWLIQLEYSLNKLPYPDLILYLTVPLEVSTKLLSDRSKKNNVQLDIHEKNLSYLDRCNIVARYCCNLFSWKEIECATSDKNNIDSIEDIHQRIYDVIKDNWNMFMNHTHLNVEYTLGINGRSLLYNSNIDPFSKNVD